MSAYSTAISTLSAALLPETLFGQAILEAHIVTRGVLGHVETALAAELPGATLQRADPTSYIVEVITRTEAGLISTIASIYVCRHQLLIYSGYDDDGRTVMTELLCGQEICDALVDGPRRQQTAEEHAAIAAEFMARLLTAGRA